MSASPPPAVAPDAIFDAVVVGGGPGGLSAALWLARYRRKALLVDAGEHRNRWTEQAHGYLGSDPVDPAVLLGRARSQLGRYDTAACVQDSVTAIRRSAGDGFTVELTGGTPVAARRIVLATGVRDEFPAVEGFFDHYGASVFHCPSCDGYEARDRRVVVLGWGAQITGFALELLDWAATVTVVTDRESLAAAPADRRSLLDRGVEVVEDRPAGLVGARGALEALEVAGGARLPCDMAFFTIDHAPLTGLAEQLGCRLGPEGYVEVDDCGRTSVEGVYAAGDLTPGLQLVQVAAAKGTSAGTACATSLRGAPAVPGAPEPGPDVGAAIDG